MVFGKTFNQILANRERFQIELKPQHLDKAISYAKENLSIDFEKVQYTEWLI